MWCPRCKKFAFVIDGLFQCCDLDIDQLPDIEQTKRISEGRFRCDRIPLKLKKQILEKQDHKCIYCQKDLAGYITNSFTGKLIKLKTHFDHFVCWNYSRDSSDYNMVASCHICNLLKSDKYFPDITSAAEFIMNQRKKKGYNDEID